MAYICVFCTSSSISLRNFNNQILLQSETSYLPNIQISRQLSISQKTNNFKPTNSTTSYIWVNPKTPKSSKVKQNTYDSRYNSLIKVAEHLNSCSPLEKDVFNVLDRNLGSKLIEQDGVIILNHMMNPETARIVLNYFLGRCSLSWKLVFYNVTLKDFRKCKDLDSAEQLFDEMTQRGIVPDNVMFSTIIACARLCSLPGKAVAWFERMAEFKIEPDDATFAVMIDAYGRVGNV